MQCRWPRFWWNGLAYVLFGIGTRAGALGIKNTGLFGAEVGVLGLVFNAAFLAALWTRYHRSGMAHVQSEQ